MPEKLRLRFEKTGRAIYISHLDLMRTMPPEKNSHNFSCRKWV